MIKIENTIIIDRLQIKNLDFLVVVYGGYNYQKAMLKNRVPDQVKHSFRLTHFVQNVLQISNFYVRRLIPNSPFYRIRKNTDRQTFD